jgi:hypothetical protein
LPSVDKEKDEGKLLAQKPLECYWCKSIKCRRKAKCDDNGDDFFDADTVVR